MWWAVEDTQGLSAGCLVQPDSAVTTRKWSMMQNLEPSKVQNGHYCPRSASEMCTIIVQTVEPVLPWRRTSREGQLRVSLA